MSWFGNDRENWIEVIQELSDIEDQTNSTIEKDIVQTMFLDKLSKSRLPFVFKGGTALAKAYGVIDRFSEDLDITMSKRPGESERKMAYETVHRICEELGLQINNPDDIFSHRSFNRYVLEYDSLFGGKERIILETSFFQNAYPSQDVEIKSASASELEKLDISFEDGRSPFRTTIRVQALERTMVDKVFAVCDYYLKGQRDKGARHLYDIAKLLSHVKPDKDLEKLIRMVRADRMELRACPSAAKGQDINGLLKEIIDSRYYEESYNSIVTRTLYEDYPYERAVKNGIQKVMNNGIFKAEPSVVSEMERVWARFFQLPKEQRTKIEWEGKSYRVAVFEDMYLMECKKEDRTPKENIKDHFWGNCVKVQGYEPVYSSREER